MSERQGGESFANTDVDESGEDFDNTHVAKSLLEPHRLSELLTAEEEVELAKLIEAGVFAREALETLEANAGLELSEVPFTTISPETLSQYSSRDEIVQDLLEIAETGKSARNRFIESNIRLVQKAVSKRKPFLDRIQPDDLVHEVIMNGLTRAVEKFDYKKGWKFSTYASWWIRNAIDEAFAEHNELFPMKRDRWTEIYTLDNHRDRLLGELGREPTIDELAVAMKCGPAKVSSIIETQNACRGVTGLDSPVRKGGETEVIDLFAPSQDSAEGMVVREMDAPESQRKVREAIGKLDDRSAAIIEWLFYSDGSMTREEFAKSIGVSYGHVNAVKKRAFAELRELLGEDGMSEVELWVSE